MNKNFSLILNIVLAVAVAVLYYLHFADKVSTTASAGTSDTSLTKLPEVTPGVLKKSKTVFVNTDSLLENYTFYKKSKADLEAKRDRIEKQIEAQQRTFEGQAMAFQEKASKGLITSEEEGRNMEAKLMKQRDEILAYRDRETNKLIEEEKKIDEKLYTLIHNYVKRYCAKTNYQYVFGYSRGSGILYANDSLDITNDVLEGLNKESK